MPNNILSAIIDVKAPNVAQTVKIVSTAVDNTTKSFSQLQRQVSAFGGGVKSFSSSFHSIAPAVNNAETSLRRITTTSSASTLALINVGRVAQDLPFGFLGIANNLNPLLESFQRLKAETGSSAAAFKSLGSSMLGAGGIGLALSVVSSLLIVFGDRLFGSSSKIKGFNADLSDLETRADAVRESIKGFNDELDFLAKIGAITVDINFGDAGERAILKARQQSVSLDNELQKLIDSGDEFRRISSEAFDQFQANASDAAQGAVRAFSTIRVVPNKLVEKLKEGDQDYVKAAKKASQDVYDNEIEIAKTREKQAVGRANIRLELTEEQRRKDKEAAEEAKRHDAEIISRAKRIAEAYKEIITLKLHILPEDEIKAQLGKAIVFLEKFSKQQFSLIFPATILIQEEDVKFPNARAIIENVTKFGDLYSAEVKKASAVPVVTQEWLSLDKMAKDFLAAQAFITAQAESLAQIINRGVQSIAVGGFASIGEGIGKALAGGDIKDIFSSFANVLATGIEEIGKQIIALGVAGVLAKEALQKVFVNPFLAIAAGTALVAVGAALKSALGNGIRGFAAGGRFPAGEDILVGEKGPEIVRFNTGGNVIPNNKIGSAMAGSGSGGKVVFEIQGNKLVGVLANTNRYQSRNK